MSILRAHNAYLDLKRYSQIISVFVRYGFGDILNRLKARYIVPLRSKILRKRLEEIESLSVPERIRLVLEELAPTFIKFGQILSTRPDLIPQDFIQEFSKLQDRVPSFSFDEVRSIVESQLGQQLTELFDSFEEQPIAAGSLAQVHRARTKTGEDVAVKIQRPNIKSIIETDIRIMYDLASLSEQYIPEIKNYEPVRIVDEFASTIHRELDYIREGRNIDRFKKYFAEDDSVYIHSVFWDLTASKVLTMEYIDGIKISNFEKLESAGLDLKTIAINGATLILKEIFDYHFFHADPHPGNLFILKNNVIAPVDYGMMGILDEETVYQMSVMLTAIVGNDVDSLSDALISIGIKPAPIDRTKFLLDLTDFLERYYDAPLSGLDIGTILNELMEMIRHYRLHLPANLIMMGKALAIYEGVGRMLYPEFNIIEHAKPYTRKLLVRRLDPTRQLKELSKATGDFAILLKKMPKDVEEIVSKVKNDELGIRFEHKGLESFIGELDRSSNRLSFAIVIAALIMGSSIVFQTGVGPTLFGYPLLGLIGYSMASIMGLWLLIGILRSGKL